MPGWHEATKELQASGSVQMVGLIQEQHPDRCRLFMQWKQMDWPVMVDALNRLEVKAVPITVFVDEHGIVRNIPGRRGDRAEMAAQFAAASFEAPARGEPSIEKPDVAGMNLDELKRAKAEALIIKGDLALLAALNAPDGAALDIAIESFRDALEHHPNPGLTHFQLGVAYRTRFDSAYRHADDFNKAIAHWQKALDLDPNQYIWRRRIEQYGPRLMKPYSFYDWVHEARSDIEVRGETPVQLAVEPSGAEFANPERTFTLDDEPRENPDPEGRIDRDKEGLIRAQVIVVPSAVKAGRAVRVHVLMTPDQSPRVKGHWNNEVDDTVVWVDVPVESGWSVDKPYLTVPRPANTKSAVSMETRQVEFELMVPEGLAPGTHSIPAFALYYVCEDVDGKCLYRRQDLAIHVNVVE